MDRSEARVPGLRAPAEGDDLSIGWRADLGGSLRVGDLVAHLGDLHVAVCIGERWGVELARASARQRGLDQVIREGPDLGGLNVPIRLGDLIVPIRSGESPLAGRTPFGYLDPGRVLETLADTQAADDLGRPMTLVQVAYRNPLEVVLTGSGFLVLGAIYALRLVRDWSNTRRIGAGAAREAEAAAREKEARSDLFRWLVDETKAGRVPVPPGDLLASVTHSDAAALERLATTDVTLQLPEGLDPLGEDSR